MADVSRPIGSMRLHWDVEDGTHLYQDFPCLNEALDYAGMLYAAGDGTLTRLENWLGENACPDDQLIPVAKIRAEGRNLRKDREAMEAHPAWGAFA